MSSDGGPGSEQRRLSSIRTGSGPDLVVLHSLLTDRHAFDRVLPALEAAWRVTRVDLPGFGDSPLVGDSVEAHADAVARLIVESGFEPASTVVMGNGWGGFVALGAAARHGDLFGSLVLVGCGSGFPPPAREAFSGMIEKVEAVGMEGVVDIALGRLFPPAFLTAHPEDAEERREVLLKTDPVAFAGACRALTTVDYSAELRNVANPTLIVVGSEDAATPPAMAREVAEGIADSVLVELDGLGHAPQLQDPARFLETVIPFLDRDRAS